MADVHSPEQRSYNMSRIRGKDTRPEMLVRRGLYALGFRYRLHRRDLPGRPDIVLSKHRAVVFVNGCFWHGHDCPLFVVPETNTRFWIEKIGANKERDARNREKLLADGWRVMTVWECSFKGRGHPPLERILEDVAAWITSAEEVSEIPARRATEQTAT